MGTIGIGGGATTSSTQVMAMSATTAFVIVPLPLLAVQVWPGVAGCVNTVIE